MKGHVLLCPNAHRDIGLSATRMAEELLRSAGHDVKIAPFLSDGTEESWPADLCTFSLEEAIEGAALAVTLINLGLSALFLFFASLLMGRK